MRRVPRWALAVFALALLARLLFLFLADQPLLYTHQYHYFENALRIAQHPHPLHYVWTSDEWRTWNQHWTIAPLYHVFAAGVFLLFGPHLLPLQLVQCVLEALAAVGVAALGRQAAGHPRGAWAGVAYALYWPSIEMPAWTMTENLHTVLLVGGIALLARLGPRRPGRLCFAAGVVLGLSALARSVTSAFIGLAVLLLAWQALRAWRRGGVTLLRALVPALALAAGGAAVILPWTARNFLVIGDHVLIETTAFENIWYANSFADREQFIRQQQVVHGQGTPAAKREVALHFALRGIRRHPGRVIAKMEEMFWHFLRPEGLQNLLRVERSQEGWRDLGSLLLDDPLLLAPLVPLLVFVVAGRATPARAFMLLWLAYYLFMVVVVFHNEIRYRSAFMPFAFAGAAGGIAAWGAGARKRPLAQAAAAAGLLLVAAIVWPFAGPAWRAVSARSAPTVEEAAARDPASARPWMDQGRADAFAGNPSAALAAYEHGQALATASNWRALLARPRLLEEVGDPRAARALATAHRLSWDSDPWLVLEVAWRELPAPRTDVVVVGGSDYGAVRGFRQPREQGVQGLHRLEVDHYDVPGQPAPPPGPHRWTRHRAWVRLVPTQPAPAYDVRVFMGSPFPSPLEAPEVTVRATGGAPQRFRLDRTVRPYTVRAVAAPGTPVTVRIDAPTWNRIGEPAEQGVRVERVDIQPGG